MKLYFEEILKFHSCGAQKEFRQNLKINYLLGQ